MLKIGKSKSTDAFQEFYGDTLKPLRTIMHDRRSHYLKRLFVRMALTAVILGTLPLYISWLHATISLALIGFLEMMGEFFPFLTPSEQELRQVDGLTKNSLTILITLSALIWSVIPAFRYRKHTVKRGGFLSRHLPGTSNSKHGTGTWHRILLKELILREILKHFGDFTFRHSGQNTSFNFLNPIIIPEFENYRAQDDIRGVYEQCTVDISLCQFTKKLPTKSSIASKKDTAIFQGLIISIDISEVGVQLRKPFVGKTVLIHKNRCDYDNVRKKLEGFTQLNLPDSLASTYELWTNNQKEAEGLLTPQLLDSLQELTGLLNNADHPKTHIDDRIMSLLGDLARPSHQRMLQNPESQDIHKGQSVVECSFREDKVHIAIPYKHALFEPKSIFEPAFSERDTHLIWSIMKILSHTIRLVLDGQGKLYNVTLPEEDEEKKISDNKTSNGTSEKKN